MDALITLPELIHASGFTEGALKIAPDPAMRDRCQSEESMASCIPPPIAQ
jgi:hypothetical protein